MSYNCANCGEQTHQAFLFCRKCGEGIWEAHLKEVSLETAASPGPPCPTCIYRTNDYCSLGGAMCEGVVSCDAYEREENE